MGRLRKYNYFCVRFMKHLSDYVIEKLIINEGFLQGVKDYEHRGDYKYVKMLFAYLFGETDELELRVCILPTIPKQEKITPTNHIELTRENFIKPDDIKKLFDKSNNEIKSVADINFKDYSLNEIDKILRNSLNSDTLTEEQYNILYNSKAKLFSRFDKFPFSGVKIPTRDQETGTCIIFNSLVTDINIKSFEDFKSTINTWIKGEKDKNVLSNIKTKLSSINSNFDNEWARSYIYQMKSIANIIDESIKDNEFNPSEFGDLRMERYGGDDDFKNEWKISVLYKNVINSYAKKIGYQKDSLDPTDVILYNSKQLNLIENILNKSKNEIQSLVVDSDNHNVDNVKFKEAFLLLYNVFNKGDDIDVNVPSQKIFFKGISLKKVTSKCKVEKFNINEETKFIFKSLNDINGKYYHAANKTIYCFVNGTIVNEDKNAHASVPAAEKSTNEALDNLPDAQTEISIGTQHRYKITLRTNGNKIACDVAQCKNDTSSTAGPSLGKCPVAVWNKHLKQFLDADKFKQSPNAKDINSYKLAYMKLFDTTDEKTIKETLSDIITCAIKCGPSCLPFIIIH